LVGEGGR